MGSIGIGPTIRGRPARPFASVMLGAAMMRGVKVAPETKVYELLAGMGPFQNPNPVKSKITLTHLMTHTSGLACNDNDDASPGNENTMQAQRDQPLQFGAYHWNLMPTDEGYLGGGAWLRPRDLLKIGQVYLDGGTWRGRRIVDSAWVTRSTTSLVHITPATTGLDEEQFSEFYGGGEDGLAWHLGGVRSGDRVHPSYMATGNGGQVLLVVSTLELAVAFTGGNYRQGGIWGRWGNEIVGGAIIPAVRR